MRKASLTLAALALAAAACAGAEAAVLSYQFRPGAELTYSFSGDVAVEVTFDVPREKTSEAPSDAAFDVTLSGDTQYSIEEGPDPGTLQITIDHSIDDVTVHKAIVDGESVEDELPPNAAAQGLAALPEVTLIVDRQGNIKSMEVDGEQLPTALFGEAFSSSQLGGAGGFHSFLGPTFPEKALTVGDTWTVEDTQQIPFFNTAMEVRREHRITGEETLGGRRVLVIETTTETEGLTLDLKDLSQGIADAGMAADEEGLAELQDQLGEAKFELVFQPSETTSSTWFDPQAGIVVRNQAQVELRGGLNFELPAEEGGGPVRIDYLLEEDITLELAEE